LTALTLDFTIPRNQPLSTAFLRLLAKIPEYPLAAPNAVVKVKQIPTTEASAYSFGWNTNHPVRVVTYSLNAWRFNSVTVEGALKSDGTYYTGAASNAAQIALVGTRHRTIVDHSLGSNAACSARATAELNYHAARNSELSISALPCHGLDVFDVITLVSTPFGGSNFTARVTSYEESYRPDEGRYEQEIELSSGFVSGAVIPTAAAQPTDDIAAPGLLPDAYIEPDTAAIVGPAALSALGVTGAVAHSTATTTAFTTRALLETEFYNVTGRPAEDGDALLTYDSGATGYRLYVRYAAARWLYFTAAGSVTA
jgi:hypothetical protein